MKHKHLLQLLLLFFLTTLYAQQNNHFECGLTHGPVTDPQNFGALNNPPLGYSGSTDPAVLAAYLPISFDIFLDYQKH